MLVLQSLVDLGSQIGFVANYASTISLIISCATLLIAKNIRHSILKNIERKDFREHAQATSDQLRSYRSNINNDQDIVTPQFYKNILNCLVEILHDYSNILPGKTRKKITSLRKEIIKYLANPNDKGFPQRCADKLHLIATDIRRERDIL